MYQEKVISLRKTLNWMLIQLTKMGAFSKYRALVIHLLNENENKMKTSSSKKMNSYHTICQLRRLLKRLVIVCQQNSTSFSHQVSKMPDLSYSLVSFKKRGLCVLDTLYSILKNTHTSVKSIWKTFLGKNNFLRYQNTMSFFNLVL